MENAAPDLSREGSRVTKAWLEGYLKHPVAIRPFGNRPGDGSRMPDFRLSDEEAAELSEALITQRAGMPAAAGGFQPRKLSAFAKAKAMALLEEKISCLGCHRLGERGGKIGPDLTNVRTRLQGDYVYAIIKEPRAVAPHSIMPRVPLPPATIQLLANFLLQQEATPQREGYLSLAENPILALGLSEGLASTHASARQNYQTHCAACHGGQGQGDGYNARFLPVKPTVHADASYMTRRPDDTLYDGVHSGGYILNRSLMMPPWGQSFSAREIQELVGYMRTLCHCEGPAWSRDH
jgi:mono/diheme cytochrome c family protein